VIAVRSDRCSSKASTLVASLIDSTDTCYPSSLRLVTGETSERPKT
jgi:hypothetical protein